MYGQGTQLLYYVKKTFHLDGGRPAWKLMGNSPVAPLTEWVSVLV